MTVNSVTNTSVPATLTLVSSTGVSVPGQYVTFTATVAPSVADGIVPTGTVLFKDGSTVLGTATLVNGAAAVSVPLFALGNRGISATYSGDSSHLASSQSLAQVVKSAALEPASQPGQFVLYVAGALNNDWFFSDTVQDIIKNKKSKDLAKDLRGW